MTTQIILFMVDDVYRILNANIYIRSSIEFFFGDDEV